MPILATMNCAAPDMIRHGHDGWLVPARARGEMLHLLRQAHADRAVLVDMVERLWERPRKRTWEDVAADFIRFAGGY
jgi:glycosyltransferase involved in cell wall biosynthesis